MEKNKSVQERKDICYFYSSFEFIINSNKMNYSQYQEPDHESSIQYFRNQLSRNRLKTNNQNSQGDWGVSRITHTQNQRKRKPLTVFDKLYERAHERLNRLKDKIIAQEKKKEETFSFTPQTNHRKNRHLCSNVIERGEIWMESRKKSKINAEQQEMLKKMKDCTFTPRLNNRANDLLCLRKENRVRNEGHSVSVTRMPTKTSADTDRFHVPDYMKPRQSVAQQSTHSPARKSLTPRKIPRSGVDKEDFLEVKQSLMSKIRNLNV